MGLDQRAKKLDMSEKPVTHLKLTPPPHQGVGKEEDSLISTQMINVKASFKGEASQTITYTDSYIAICICADKTK